MIHPRKEEKGGLMFKNIKNVFLSSAAVLLLSSCYNNTNPHNTLKSVGVAIQKSDMKNYPNFFIGQAKTQYGNAQGMEILRSKGLGEKKLRLSEKTLVSRRDYSPRRWTSVWAVDVWGQSSVIANTQVTCDSEVHREEGPERCYTECFETDRGSYCHRRCERGFPQDVTYTECAVSELRLR